MEYCVQLWSPVAAHGSWGTIYELEKVQRKFTNLIDDIGTLPYGTRLAELDLTTLAERRVSNPWVRGRSHLEAVPPS